MRNRIYNLYAAGVYLFVVLFIVPLPCRAEQKAQDQKPLNVLMIAVDDLKPNIGSFGDTIALTPHIDKLAQAGTVFFNNHCQQAVCAPTRASLMTGLRPDRTRVWDLKTMMRDKNPDIVTLPQYLIQHGYRTAGFGKIFDQLSVDRKGDSLSWSMGYDWVNRQRWVYQEKMSSEISNEADSLYCDFVIADKGIAMLKKLKKSADPFFLALGFRKPHLPFAAVKRFWDLYKRDDFSAHPFQKMPAKAPGIGYQPGWELRNNYADIDKEAPIPPAKQKELIHGYYACVSQTDYLIGRVIEAIKDLDLYENTIIVIWGDHGG